MLEASGPKRLFRFGVYELESHTGELRKDGKNCPRLQGQPLLMLLMLLERPGELVTREELRLRLWPADTFVDYDHSLNTAVNKLRDVLNDAAANPRFIQTLPRRGYRFVAPVGVVEPAANLESPGAAPPRMPPESVEAPLADPADNRIRVLSDPQELPPARQTTTRWLFSLLQIMYLGFYVAFLADLRQTDTLIGEVLHNPTWAFVLLLLTAAAGIPVRLYLLFAVLFGYGRLSNRFQSYFRLCFSWTNSGPWRRFYWCVGLGMVWRWRPRPRLFLPFSQL